MTTFREVPAGEYVPQSFHIDVDKDSWELVDDIMEALMDANPFAAPEVLAPVAERLALQAIL